MMGLRGGSQEQLFYSFNLEDHVPSNHLLRAIDRVFDLSDLRDHLAPYYSNTGRPSIDPELMVRMLIVGYCFGIRSERRLCEEIHLNLAYRWFCRLGLEDAIPDHSTFSKNRHGRFRDSEVLRHVFETVLRRCMAEGLVRGEGFAIDASVIEADANRSRAVPGTQNIDWNKGDGPSRAVREYLSALDKFNRSADEETNNSGATPAPKSVSLTDPAARWTAAPGGPAFTMIERVEQRFAIKPQRLVGDTAYGTAPMLGWMVDEKQIAPHVPVWDKVRRDGTFEREAFVWNARNNEYRCPAGHPMRSDWRAYTNPRTHITKADTVIYRSSQHNCSGCAMKEQCCPNMLFRNIARSIHEDARDVARKISKTPEYRQSRRERKKVEMLFAHLKRILKLDRLRLRGLNGAQDEFLLAATAQNLRRMAKRLTPRDGATEPQVA